MADDCIRGAIRKAERLHSRRIMVSGRPRQLEDQPTEQQVQAEVAVGEQAVITFDNTNSSASTYHELLQAPVNFGSNYGAPPDARGWAPYVGEQEGSNPLTMQQQADELERAVAHNNMEVEGQGVVRPTT